MTEENSTSQGDALEAAPASSTPAAGDGAGSVSAAELTRRGIVRTSVDQFEVGGYRYSSLKDAMAQSDRAHAAPGTYA
jgi:hypothetical protein